MYADAASFVLRVEVFPDGVMVASSDDEDRLKACSSHVLKPLGFEFKVKLKRWEHAGGCLSRLREDAALV